MVVGPEASHFNDLWDMEAFTSSLLYVVIDEAHCCLEWSFRSAYTRLGRLRTLIGRSVPIYLASATLTPPMLEDLSKLFSLQQISTSRILYSNDTPNIAISARPMKHSAKSCIDLSFLLRPHVYPGPISQHFSGIPPIFLVFFDNISDAQKTCKKLCEYMPEQLCDRLTWFHLEMSVSHRERVLRDIKNGKIWGVFCTESFGLVSTGTFCHQIHQT
jgi:superfamily II DNA helicase RecQ